MEGRAGPHHPQLISSEPSASRSPPRYRNTHACSLRTLDNPVSKDWQRQVHDKRHPRRLPSFWGEGGGETRRQLGLHEEAVGLVPKPRAKPAAPQDLQRQFRSKPACFTWRLTTNSWAFTLQLAACHRLPNVGKVRHSKLIVPRPNRTFASQPLCPCRFLKLCLITSLIGSVWNQHLVERKSCTAIIAIAHAYPPHCASNCDLFLSLFI